MRTRMRWVITPHLLGGICCAETISPKTRIAEYVHARSDAEAGTGRRGHTAVAAVCGAPLEVLTVDVAVEVGGGEEHFGGRALCQVRDGGCGDVARPRCLRW